MKRRNFIIQSSIAGSGLLVLPSFSEFGNSGKPVRWIKIGKLFSSVACDGNPLLTNNQLLDVSLKLTDDSSESRIDLGTSSPTFQNRVFKAELEHRLINSNNGEDLLQATLSIDNQSMVMNRTCRNFANSVWEWPPSTAIIRPSATSFTLTARHGKLCAVIRQAL